MAQEHILGRQLQRCPFKVGDIVNVKGKKARSGYVIKLIDDPSEASWNKNGTQPFFIAVDFVKGHIVNGDQIEYDHDVHLFPLKMLKAIR